MAEYAKITDVDLKKFIDKTFPVCVRIDSEYPHVKLNQAEQWGHEHFGPSSHAYRCMDDDVDSYDDIHFDLEHSATNRWYVNGHYFCFKNTNDACLFRLVCA